MNKRLRKLLSKVKRYSYYFKSIGFKNTFFFFLSDIFNKKITKLLEISSERIFVRTSTPDLQVSINTFVNKEYENLKVKDPKIIIDAGAYIGTASLYFAKRFPNARIFAIEPEKENYELLLKNTSKYKNIIPINAALWHQEEIKIIQNRFTGPWGYTISETKNRKKTTNQKVKCITMDFFLKELDINYIDILKMDIEGSEKEIFEDADDWINKVGLITIELHDRIVPGCSEAFYQAAKNFAKIEKNGEKITVCDNR